MTTLAKAAETNRYQRLAQRSHQDQEDQEEEDYQQNVMNISLRDHCDILTNNKTITNTNNTNSIMVDEEDDYQFTMPVSSILEKYQDDQRENRKRRLFLWILIGLMIVSISILTVCFFTYRRYIIEIVFHHHLYNASSSSFSSSSSSSYYDRNVQPSCSF